MDPYTRLCEVVLTRQVVCYPPYEDNSSVGELEEPRTALPIRLVAPDGPSHPGWASVFPTYLTGTILVRNPATDLTCLPWTRQ